MAFETPWNDISIFQATTGLTQYSWVTLNSSAKWTQASNSSAGFNAVGILVSSGTTGSTRETAQTIRPFGPVSQSRVSTGSTTISAGDVVTLSTDGVGVAPSTAGDYRVALALEDVNSTSDIISVLMYPIGSS